MFISSYGKLKEGQEFSFSLTGPTFYSYSPAFPKHTSYNGRTIYVAEIKGHGPMAAWGDEVVFSTHSFK